MEESFAAERAASLERQELELYRRAEAAERNAAERIARQEATIRTVVCAAKEKLAGRDQDLAARTASIAEEVRF